MTAPIGPGRHRVHPLTPLLSAGRFLAAALAVAVFNVIQSRAAEVQRCGNLAPGATC